MTPYFYLLLRQQFSQGRDQGVLETINFVFRLESKQTETQSVLGVFWYVSRNQNIFFGSFQFVSVFLTSIETT